MQEDEKDDAGKDESDQDGVANAGDALPYQFGLIIKRYEMIAWRKLSQNASTNECGTSGATAVPSASAKRI